MKQGCVFIVSTLFKPINTANKDFARINAAIRVEPVYNLMVQDQHEYFANGILVANCVDSVRYGCEPFIRHPPKFQTGQIRGLV